MKQFAYIKVAATLVLAASVMPAQVGGLGRIKDAAKKVEEAASSPKTNPSGPPTTPQSPDAPVAGTPGTDPGNQQQRGWERAQVSNISNWYAQKAFLTEACNAGGSAAVKAEMVSFVGSQEASLVDAANSAFDQAYSSRLRGGSGIDAARQACGTNRHSGNMRSAESALDQAKANFLEQMRRRNQQPPAAADGQSTPPTYPGVPTAESIAAAQRQQQAAEAPAKISPADPRIASLSAADRELALNEANNIAPYCGENVTLGNFYDCGCFASRLLDERLKAGLETRFDRFGQAVLVPPTSSLIMKMTSSQVGVRECVAPAKIQRYGARRADEINFAVPEPRRSQISACVGADIAAKFQAKPIGDMIYINKLMSDAMVTCNRAGQ